MSLLPRHGPSCLAAVRFPFSARTFCAGPGRRDRSPLFPSRASLIRLAHLAELRDRHIVQELYLTGQGVPENILPAGKRHLCSTRFHNEIDPGLALADSKSAGFASMKNAKGIDISCQVACLCFYHLRQRFERITIGYIFRDNRFRS